jgi:hypothetical protein
MGARGLPLAAVSLPAMEVPTPRPASAAEGGQRPLLLLDVDGVLCPFEGDPPSVRRVGPEGYERVDLSGDELDPHLWISRANADHLSRLAERFDIVWATGWGEHANRVIGPLHRLGELPVVELYDGGGATWKLASVGAYVGEQRPCVWIDDDLNEDAEQWAERRPGPTLLLRCEPHLGLTEEIVERCFRWLDGLPS